jgi:hypothetical protein
MLNNAPSNNANRKLQTTHQSDKSVAPSRNVKKIKDIFHKDNVIPELQVVVASNSFQVAKDQFQEQYICINDSNFSLIMKDRVRHNNGGNGLITCVYICSCQVGSLDTDIVRIRFSIPYTEDGVTFPQYVFQIHYPNDLDRNVVTNHFRLRGINQRRTINSTSYNCPVVLEDFDGKSIMTNMGEGDINTEIIRTQCSIAAINALVATKNVMNVHTTTPIPATATVSTVSAVAPADVLSKNEVEVSPYDKSTVAVADACSENEVQVITDDKSHATDDNHLLSVADMPTVASTVDNVDNRKPPPTNKVDNRKPPPMNNVDNRKPPPMNNVDNRKPPPNSKRKGKVITTRSVARKKQQSSVATAQQRNLESIDESDEESILPNENRVANLKDDAVSENSDDDIDTPIINLQPVKQEPLDVTPNAAEEIAKRGRKPMSDKNVFEKLFMLSTTEHKLRLGFYDQKINEPPTEGDDKYKTVNDFEVNEEFLAKLPHKLRNVTTCVICLEDIDITKECVVNLNCEQKYPRIPHPIHKGCYDPMITWDVSDKVIIPTVVTTPPTTTAESDDSNITLPDVNEIKVIQKCPVCRAEGDYILSRFNDNNNQWERWIKPPDGLTGVTVYGAHRYTSVTTKRQYQHYITNKNLMHALGRMLKVEGPRIDKPVDLRVKDIKPLFVKYCEMNNDVFTCGHCNSSVINIFKIYLFGCEPECAYLICRDCFLDRITNEKEIQGKEKNDGYLLCELCNKPGRAYYDVVHLPVADRQREGLK